MGLHAFVRKTCISFPWSLETDPQGQSGCLGFQRRGQYQDGQQIPAEQVGGGAVLDSRADTQLMWPSTGPDVQEYMLDKYLWKERMNSA